nr:hypothetical protein [Cordyceps tenuipes]
MEREQFYLDEINPSYKKSLFYGKHSAETIEQLKDREFTQEHKDNLAKAREGREFSALRPRSKDLVLDREEETLKKLSESLSKHHKEHPLTPEAFENIKRKTTEREGVPVALINKDTGEETQFETQTDAANFLGITRQAIKKALDRDSILSKLYKVKRSDQNNNNRLSSIDNNSSSGDSNSSSGDDGGD